MSAKIPAIRMKPMTIRTGGIEPVEIKNPESNMATRTNGAVSESIRAK
jgi:hypothetical protein